MWCICDEARDAWENVREEVGRGGAAVYIVNAIRPGDSVFSQSGGMNSRNGRV